MILDAPPHFPGRRGPRLRNDPDRYIWRQYGAWAVVAPCPRTGARTYVGTFACDGDARRARDEFLAGRRPAHPRGVRRIRTRDGAAFAVWRHGIQLRFASEEDAAAWLRTQRRRTRRG